jgi:hypothetical protein
MLGAPHHDVERVTLCGEFGATAVDCHPKQARGLVRRAHVIGKASKTASRWRCMLAYVSYCFQTVTTGRGRRIAQRRGHQNLVDSPA